MSTRQSAFTLIELIMVIVLLGILGAVAIPRMYDFGAPARAARVNAALDAVRVTVAAVHSQSMISGKGMGATAETMSFRGSDISVRHGYPANRYSLLLAANLLDDFVGAGHEDDEGVCNTAQTPYCGIVHRNAHDMATGTCGFMYQLPANTGDSFKFVAWPGSSFPVAAADCRQ
ncbi:type II secretion system protein [Pseudomonas sp. ABC1]|nr:type II secretion system protein [Pseudomonas sp. ABC1]